MEVLYMKRLILFSIFFFLFSFAFAQQATITELTGTVELKRANSAAWEPAAKGQSIPVDTIISTGFKSTALINLGNSIITVRPLTRLSITEIASRAGTETINVNLQAGRVRADVNPPAGARSSFTVQMPSVTASTRGTIFEVGIFELRVMEGSIEYRGTSGAPVVVDAGAFSYVDETTGRAAFPEATLLTTLNPDLPIAADLLYPFEGASLQSTPSLEVGAAISYP
jgi:hypothetical protein